MTQQYPNQNQPLNQGPVQSTQNFGANVLNPIPNLPANQQIPVNQYPQRPMTFPQPIATPFIQPIQQNQGNFMQTTSFGGLPPLPEGSNNEIGTPQNNQLITAKGSKSGLMSKFMIFIFLILIVGQLGYISYKYSETTGKSIFTLFTGETNTNKSSGKVSTTPKTTPTKSATPKATVTPYKSNANDGELTTEFYDTEDKE